MTSARRPLEIVAFLDQHGWGDADAQLFAGDFSSRRYARLVKPDNQTAILMDADQNQNTPQFVAIAQRLRAAGIRAPQIYAAQPDKGLVLMEDFGTRNVGGLLDAGGAARGYYLRAADILATLHRHCDDSRVMGLDLPLYTTELFVDQAALFLDAYIPLARQREATPKERENFADLWRGVLRPLETLPKTLLLRDFMPDNLMDLSVAPHPAPQGEGEILGVLDFQDAGIGCIAYDLASLCEEVRRDGGFAWLPEVIAHYRQASGTAISQHDLLRAATILSAQRHTRILGIIAQRTIRTGRREKLDYLPRIVGHLDTVLQQADLVPIRDYMRDVGCLS